MKYKIKNKTFLSVILTILLTSYCQPLFAQGKISRNNQPATKTSQTKMSVSGSLNGHEYVDLGLPSGTLWATCNLGSNSPAGYGSYYAWAETNPKAKYTIENNKTYNLSQFADGLGYIKTDTVRELVRIISNPTYDAATANWGEGWELPSAGDFTELNNECTWQLKTIDGHKGYLITGSNGNSIFLPMSGNIEGTHKSQIGSGGFYWTGDFWDDKERSTMFDFHEGSHNGVIWSYRHNGKSIRPVLTNRKSSINWSTNQ